MILQRKPRAPKTRRRRSVWRNGCASGASVDMCNPGLQAPAARPWVKVTIGLSLIAAACGDGLVPSADTNFLRTQLLPRLLEWGRTQEPSLDLRPLLQGRGYDHFCVILPYNRISDIEGKIPQRVRVYYSEPTTAPSAPGSSVVDGFALIAVKGGEAHSLWVRRSPLQLTVNPEVTCYRTGEATLKRVSVPNSKAIHAALEKK